MPYQSIYSSQASRPMQASDLEQILEDARAGNVARDVTGVLIYSDAVFVQVLEGERVTVEALVESIRADDRHHSMKVFHAAEVPQRAFADWRMAYVSADAAELSRWVGLAGGQSIADLVRHLHADPSAVPKILVRIVDAIAAQSGAG